MRKLHEQMKELVQCQGKQTKEYIDKKYKEILDTDNIDINELNKVINILRNTLNSDEDIITVLKGLVERNTNKTKEIENILVEFKTSNISLKRDMENANKNAKECLRTLEDDIFIDVSELCTIFGNSLVGPDISEDL